MSSSTSKPLAVVTGGASGIGLALVKDLLGRGFRVTVLDVNEAAMQAIAADQGDVSVQRCDTSDAAMVEAVIGDIEQSAGPIDRFIHCAAIMPGGELADIDTQTINKTMTVNYMGTVNVTKAVLAAMLERDRGTLVVIGSMAGSVLTHGLGAYCASKAATNTYLEVLQEENTSNVHIMAVHPPMVKTPLIDQAVEGGPSSLKESAATGSNMVTPELIVEAINRGIEHKTEVVYPGNARTMVRLRRFFPGLLWWIMRKANGKA
jgi:short-subunit dehydrogenase